MNCFQRIRNNIIRCTYSPDEQIYEGTAIIEPHMQQGEEVWNCPLNVQDVRFLPRKIYTTTPDGKAIVHTYKTVDGQRTEITNLKKKFDRTAWRGELQLKWDSEEKIFGFGQDEDGVWNKRGQVTYLYQHNMRIPIPMFVSNQGYGVLFDCGCLMKVDDTGAVCKIIFECVKQIDFYVISGSLDEIVAGFRELTGRAAPIADWAFGYWQSREHYKTQEELLEVARRHREAEVPLDVVVQDWKSWEGDLWGEKLLDKKRYPNISDTMDQLHDMNVHSVVSIWPNMSVGGQNHREFAEAGLLLNDYSTYNAFSEKGRKLYWKQAEQELYQGGFDGWWCDNSEPFTASDWRGCVKLPEEERYHLVGGDHERYLDPGEANLFGLVHAQGIYENHPEKPFVNLTRSGWAGSQKYGVVLWAGDTCATWEELRREIAKGMSVSISGIPYWTVDAGAFFVGGTECWRKWCADANADPVWFWNGDYDLGVGDTRYQELYTRWIQFACFLPIFRSHGTDTNREFWNFSEPYRSVIQQTIRLRYRLMPYILELARKVTQEHFTIMRTMAFDFPDDPKAWTISDQFMFGDKLLICPVTAPMMQQTPIMNWQCYLPKGSDWVDFHTRRKYPGGEQVTVPVTLDTIPVFVRAGTTLPLCKNKQFVCQPCEIEYVHF